MQNNANGAGNGKPATPGQFISYETTIPTALAIARRRWGWILLSMLMGIALAATYFMIAPREYESTAQVLVMRKDPKLAAAGVQGSNEAEARISEDLLATHIQLVQSKRIVSQALADDGLDKLKSITDLLDEDQTAAQYVIDNLYVTRGGTGQSKTAHVLQISFRHTSPEDAKAVVESLVKSYQRFLGEKFQDVNKEAAELIAQAQTELAEELEKAEKEYTEFRQRAPLLWKGQESSNTHRDRYEQIQAELGQLQSLTTEARTRLNVVEEGLARFDAEKVNDIQLLALIDEKNAARLGVLVQVDRGEAETAEFQSRQPARLETARAEYEMLSNLIVKEQTLLQNFGPEHPEVKSVRNQIQTLQGFLDKKSQSLGFRGEERVLTPRLLIDAYIKLLRQDLYTLEKQSLELTKLADAEAEAAKALVSYELEGESLRKSANRTQDLYDAVVDRLREINLAKDYGGFINEVIAEPEIGEKVSPKLLVTAILGLLSGSVLSLVTVGAAELSDRSFRTAEEIHHALDLPVLTHVPSLSVDSDRKVAAAIAESGSGLDPTLRTFHRPKSRESEVFRGLRTNLFFSADGKKLQVIECTSPNQGDGKSTLAGNLAISIAQTGRKVLLVDCDMRRPRVHVMFGIANDIGLADIIDGKTEPWDAVKPTEVDNLYALPCGTIPDNPAELLTSPAFENFLSMVRERYDYIILDCPPVLVVADPCIVAPRVDGVVMAVRVSKDSRPQTLRAKQLLSEIDAPILGVVVNCCDSGTHYGRYGYGDRYGSSGSYGYGYGYIYGGENSSKYYEESDVATRRPQRTQRV